MTKAFLMKAVAFRRKDETATKLNISDRRLYSLQLFENNIVKILMDALLFWRTKCTKQFDSGPLMYYRIY